MMEKLMEERRAKNLLETELRNKNRTINELKSMLGTYRS
jgi:hypothetical protein